MNGRRFSFSGKLTSCFSLSCALSLLLMTHDKEHIAFFYDDWSKSTFEQQVIFCLSQNHLSCGLACRLVITTSDNVLGLLILIGRNQPGNVCEIYRRTQVSQYWNAQHFSKFVVEYACFFLWPFSKFSTNNWKSIFSGLGWEKVMNDLKVH